jgi:hypothetical protein
MVGSIIDAYGGEVLRDLAGGAVPQLREQRIPTPLASMLPGNTDKTVKYGLQEISSPLPVASLLVRWAHDVDGDRL